MLPPPGGDLMKPLCSLPIKVFVDNKTRFWPARKTGFEKTGI
jgi:hypothetical protein